MDPVIAANGDYLSTIVINGTNLPVAAPSQIGEESGSTGVVQVSDDGNGETCFITCGWTAGGGATGTDTCEVTIGASTSTQMILGVGDEGTLCTSLEDDYILSGDNVTVTLYNPDGSQYGSVTAAAVSAGATPSVTSVNPPYGPEGGGTAANPGNGTVTIETDATTAPEAIWFGGIGVTTDLFGVATTDFTATGQPGEYDVVPPPFLYGGQSQNDGVNVMTADATNGMSQESCTLEVAGCADEYFYLDSDSGSFTSPSLTGFELTEQLSTFGSAGNACGQTVYNNSSPGGSITANFSGGPIEVTSDYGTSDSDSGLPEALVGSATVTVESPISVTVSGNLTVGGCLEVPFPDLALPDGLGGLYFVVGGSISGSINLTVTIDQGTYTINGGYVPGSQPADLGGASVTTQCQDSNGNPTKHCVTTAVTASLAGTLVVAPLWLSFGPSEVNVGAGLIGAATGTITIPPPSGGALDYDVCVGGLATAQVAVGDFSASYSVPWAGPFNILGDGSICPIGSTSSSPLPVVTSIAPTTGGAGTTVDIKGSGFTGATQVLFGSVPASSFKVHGDTEVTATAPAGSGTVDVSVDTGDGDSGLSPADQFTYYSGPVPVITALSSSQGADSGGTSVTISGSGFTGATEVLFGTVAATSFSVTDDSTVVATAPPGSGTVNVKVVGSGGATSAVVRADQFRYVARPAVTSLSVKQGPKAGGTVVILTGRAFVGVTAVSFGKRPATSFTVLSAESISAVAPAGTGTVSVSVTALGGTSARHAGNLYKY